MTLKTALKLKPLQIPDLPPLIEIPPDGLSLGRDPANLVVLDSELFPQVSAYHARIDVDEGRLILVDLESKNGTLLNERPVEKSPLSPGDVIQLGPQGPRFLAVAPSPMEATVLVKKPAGGKAEPRPMSPSTVSRLRSALGLPRDESQVRKMVNTRLRGILTLILLMVFIMTVGGWYVWSRYEEAREEERRKDLAGNARIEKIERLNRELRARLDEATAELAAQNARLEDQRRAWEDQKAGLERDRENLLVQIRNLESEGKSSSREVQKLRSELDATNVRLEKYNPINLEKEKTAQREKLRGVLAAVVFIEKKVEFRDTNTGKFLHYEDGPIGVELNLEERGERLSREGSGSGFCVSPAGWLLTNAHVVRQPRLRNFELEDWLLEAVVEISVVFSGEARRHEARVERLAEGDDDLALLKIEPFEGIPHVEGFTVEGVDVLPGSEVRLFGFPLGRGIIQEGETLTASIFSGIVSRKVEPFLQIQAAVYPGNSGGPAVDENGRVVGVVTGVQTIASGQIASDIGYVIPIARARQVWPPRQEEEEKAEEQEEKDGKDGKDGKDETDEKAENDRAGKEEGES